MTTDTTLRIGAHEIRVPYDVAQKTVQTAAAVGRRGGFVPISPDVAVWVTPNTPISITSEGRYADLYADMLTSPLTPKTRTGQSL